MVEREPEPDPPPFRVVGTAQMGGAGIALVQLEDSPSPAIVSVGESMLGYRLQQVETDAATVVGQGQSFRLAVESGEVAGGERTERRGGRNERNNRNAEEQVAERLRGVLEQLQERGLPAQMIEQLMRQQMGGRGRSIEVRRDSDGPPRVIIRTRPDTLSIQPPHTPEPR
jgi:chorismate mutase